MIVMPIIKSAQKKLRKDRKRTEHNVGLKRTLKEAVKTFTKSASVKSKKGNKALAATFSTIDKAAKKNIIHKNKAARMKSRISKLSRGAQ